MNTFKHLLLISAVVGLLGSTESQAMEISSIDDISASHSRQLYNALPEVEDADASLQSHPLFQKALDEIGEVVVRYEKEDSIGLRLIHKHFTLKADEVMVENYDLYEGKPSLVTCAHSLKEAQEKEALPASWIFKGKKEMNLFEASTDEAVKRGVKALSKEPEFFEEIGSVLDENNISSLFSLAILQKDSLTTDREDEHYVETNLGGVEKSVVQIWKVKTTPDFYTRTSWSFKGPKQHRCVKSTWCHRPTPLGHERVYDHLSTPGRSAETRECTLL